MTPALPPCGSAAAPNYWRFETSGILALAVSRYFDDPDSLSMHDVSILRAYLREWIMSPVWDMNPAESAPGRFALAKLRREVETIMTGREASRWLVLAMTIGIDPL